MNNHNKADGFERRLELYLMENFRHAFDIERLVILCLGLVIITDKA
jgi:beta-mannosidase